MSRARPRDRLSSRQAFLSNSSYENGLKIAGSAHEDSTRSAAPRFFSPANSTQRKTQMNALSMMSSTPGLSLCPSLRGQVVAITGAASGIGRATAARLASIGAFLSLADANAKGLEEAEATLRTRADTDGSGARFFARVLDVRNPGATREWIVDTVAFYNGTPLAAAANLAGVFGPSIAQERGTIRNVGSDEFDWVMAVNCHGLFNCLQAELQFMRSGSEGYGGGSIVNAASIAGLVGVDGNGPYAASKHAVVGLTRTAAKEECARAIRVNAIAP